MSSKASVTFRKRSQAICKCDERQKAAAVSRNEKLIHVSKSLKKTPVFKRSARMSSHVIAKVGSVMGISVFY